MKLKTWDNVGEAIKTYGLLMIDRSRVEGDLNKRIARLKDRLGKKSESFDKKMAVIEQGLNGWCEDNRKEMDAVKRGKGLTWKCTFGKVAFRACPPSITFVKKNLQKVLAALKARKLFNCVRMVEEPNKEIMETLDDKTLKEVGATRSAAEKFEIKPDYTKIYPSNTDATRRTSR